MDSKPTSDAIIDNVEKIRAENNSLWMDILRLAYLMAPNQTRAIIKEIRKNDKEITDWLKKL